MPNVKYRNSTLEIGLFLDAKRTGVKICSDRPTDDRSIHPYRLTANRSVESEPHRRYETHITINVMMSLCRSLNYDSYKRFAMSFGGMQGSLRA